MTSFFNVFNVIYYLGHSHLSSSQQFFSEMVNNIFYLGIFFIWELPSFFFCRFTHQKTLLYIFETLKCAFFKVENKVFTYVFL